MGRGLRRAGLFAVGDSDGERSSAVVIGGLRIYLAGTDDPGVGILAIHFHADAIDGGGGVATVEIGSIPQGETGGEVGTVDFEPRSRSEVGTCAEAAGADDVIDGGRARDAGALRLECVRCCVDVIAFVFMAVAVDGVARQVEVNRLRRRGGRGPGEGPGVGRRCGVFDEFDGGAGGAIAVRGARHFVIADDGDAGIGWISEATALAVGLIAFAARGHLETEQLIHGVGDAHGDRDGGPGCVGRTLGEGRADAATVGVERSTFTFLGGGMASGGGAGIGGGHREPMYSADRVPSL